MYDMYRYDAYQEPLTSRANQAELDKWDSHGADTAEPTDYENARLVEMAERAAATDSLSCQVAAHAIVRRTIEVMKL